jgi:very-short-patch-repair endonuclease
MQRLELYALDHHGLVTRAAAERAGMSTSAWYRCLSSGRFEAVHPNVARLYGSPDTHEQRIAAAVLAASPGAMASHRSAARLWDIPRPDDDPVDIIVVSRTRGLALDGVIVHRPRDDKDLSPVLRKNIPTCNILRLGCDIGAVDPRSAREAVLHIVTNAIASPRALRTACDVHTRPGRPGVPALRAALDEFMIDGKPVDSILESTMRDVRTRFRLPPMEFHAKVCGYEVDFLVTGTPVVLECDGWDSHGRHRRLFERDRERTATLVAAGHVVVPFTWRKLVRDPEWVARKVRAAADRWRPPDLGVLVRGIRE